MITCKEFFLDDFMAVTAIPIANIPANSVSSPVCQLTPTIDKDFFYPSLDDAITIGLQAYESGLTLIPIIRHTGKAKDEESDAVSGRSHTVTVTCDVDERDVEIWTPLLALERTPSHLLLTFRDESAAFVAATNDNYMFNVSRDGAKTTVTFRIQNLMGIQALA